MTKRWLTFDGAHRRLNTLTGEWILVSPQRMARPWQGQVEDPYQARRRPYDPSCYLCPGNPRAGGVRNPLYEDTFVFTNDFPALQPEQSPGEERDIPLLRARAEPGTCRVICFSPRHDLTLAEMPLEGIRRVVDEWALQVAELEERYPWVQVFENKGEIMGASNPHPHGQIWACASIPSVPAREEWAQKAYRDEHRRPLLLDYVELEMGIGERLVVANIDWAVVVPFWATWPFETLLLPRFSVRRLTALEPAHRETLASILKTLLSAYDSLFEVPFPYSMGWHGAPGPAGGSDYWTLHAHYFPPLLRSASVRKFMVGYELLAEAQRDLTPEAAAEQLRAASARAITSSTIHCSHETMSSP